MQQNLSLFIQRIILYTLVIAGLEYIATTQLNPKWVSSSWPFIILFFLSFTILLHRQLLKSTEDNPKKFVFTFLMMTTVKILLYLAVILIYVMINRDDAIGFIIAFFANYFLYTAFELSAVMKLMKKASKH